VILVAVLAAELGAPLVRELPATPTAVVTRLAPDPYLSPQLVPPAEAPAPHQPSAPRRAAIGVSAPLALAPSPYEFAPPRDLAPNPYGALAELGPNPYLGRYTEGPALPFTSPPHEPSALRRSASGFGRRLALAPSPYEMAAALDLAPNPY
jgi:hypothetical protein